MFVVRPEKKILLAISMLYQVMERCTTFEAVDESL